MEDSYSYVPLLVGSLLVVSSLVSGLVVVDARDRPNSNSIPATAGNDAQLTTANATESPAGATEAGTTTQPDEVTRHVGPVTVTIFLNCSLLEVDVEPSGYAYDLKLVYRDIETGQRVPILAGPFTGFIDDPFGETGFQLVEVQVQVERLPSTGQFAPERCLAG